MQRSGQCKVELLTEEQGVEGDGFSQRHADNGLDEDFDRRARIATDGLNGLRANKTDAKGGTKAAKGALNASGDFSDDVVVHM